MEKNKILSKLNIRIKDYNNELEKILENKLFSYDVKNLLLSMLYKIENAYSDYETVKVEVPTKNDFIENLLRIIKEKALKIFIVKVGTVEAEELEKNNLTYKIDKQNGEIICYQNELVILEALIDLDDTYKTVEVPYDYVLEPLNTMLTMGNLDSRAEVIRDFNGWSWDIVLKEINDIQYNYIYETILLLNGKNNIYKKKHKLFYDEIIKLLVRKYFNNSNNLDYAENLKNRKKEVSEQLYLFENKKEFVSRITEEKKEFTKQIEIIDKILNDNELLKKEYYKRNEKLPNKEKIFSISYLVRILIKEREELLSKIDYSNSIILPKEFISNKSKIEKEKNFLQNIEAKVELKDLLQIANEFLQIAKGIIDKIEETNKSDLIKWMYKIRYYRYVPITEDKFIKDMPELEEKFDSIIKAIIKKAQILKIWDNFCDDNDITFKILKEVFNTKIIYLQNINIQCRYENKVLYVEFLDDTIIENTININAENIRIKRKTKLFI